MKKEPLVIWGAAGHALVATDIVNLSGYFEVVGYLDDINPHTWGQAFCGAEVRGGREKLAGFGKEGVRWLFLAIGDCEARLSVARLARELGFEFATLIHPRAVVAAGVV